MNYGTSLFGVLKSSAVELPFTPASDVIHGAVLLFGIGSCPSHYGVNRKKWNNLKRVPIGIAGRHKFHSGLTSFIVP